MPPALPQLTRSPHDKMCSLSLLLLLSVAAVALALANWSALPDWRPGPLFWAIVLGLALTNLPRVRAFDAVTAAGQDGFQRGLGIARGPVLRSGVVLMGFQITVQDIQGLGWTSLLLAAWMLISTLGLMFWLGRRLFKLEAPLVLLIAAGSAICGAAAVLAVSQVSRAQTAHIAVATATVVLFGTVAMFLYPLLYSVLGMDEQTYGLFVGATVHEVAQVMVAGDLVSAEAAHAALITKLQRVLMLAPVLLLLASGAAKTLRGQEPDSSVGQAGNGARMSSGTSLPRLPWFALWFLVAVGVHSTGWLAGAVQEGLVILGTGLLTISMVAVGLSTHWLAVKSAGWGPMLLAACGALYLIVGGYITTLVLVSV